MATTTLLGYGAWRSPITSAQIAADTVGLSQVQVRGAETFWVESRPAEGGRNVILRRGPSGITEDVNPAPFNARSLIHEYGGGAYLLLPDAVVFTNLADQMLYRQSKPGGAPEQLTKEANLRFADGTHDAPRKRIISVCEDHRPQKEAKNYLVSISIPGGNVKELATGHDFCSSPALSPDGRSLAWMSWDHPNMPWDSSELWLADFADDGSLCNQRKVSGGGDESVFCPHWSPDGVLYFVSDRHGWWNLQRWTGSQVEAVLEMEAEFGLPQWTLGLSTFGFTGKASILCGFVQKGFWKLGTLDTSAKKLTPLAIPYSAIFEVHAALGRAVIIAGAPALPTAVVEIDPATGNATVLRPSSSVQLDPRFVSLPEPIEFPTSNELTAHALYYPPRNDDFTPVQGELPPLILTVHGGPTAATTAALNLTTQFWTSRGFAFVDVNYGGSTGYGRAYRQRLKGMWGVVDLDDAVNAALYLARAGKIDGQRMATSGGSAGGYTALCAITFRDVFQAAASLYGISDLEALARETHKFESRYAFWLIGPYPEASALYKARSPVHFADRIKAPVIFLQGEEDEVVPPNQTVMMANALLANGKLFGLLMFAGEQHGFRKADNIRRALDAELDFFSFVLTRSGLRF